MYECLELKKNFFEIKQIKKGWVGALLVNNVQDQGGHPLKNFYKSYVCDLTNIYFPLLIAI